jgi:hypothetical protein
MGRIIRRGQVLVDHCLLDAGEELGQRQVEPLEQVAERRQRRYGSPVLDGRHEGAGQRIADGRLRQPALEAPPAELVSEGAPPPSRSWTGGEAPVD